MTVMIRTSSLAGFPELVHDLGGDPDEFLRLMQVDPATLDNGSDLIPYRVMIELLELCAERLKCDSFGLQLAERQNLLILGPLAVVAQNACNVGEALAEICTFLHIYSPGVLVYVDTEIDEGMPQLRFDLRLRPMPPQGQITELSLGVMHNAMKMLYGPGFQPVSVLLRTEARLPQSQYQRFFGTHVYFGQAHNALVLSQEHLNRRIDQHNTLLHDTMMGYVCSMDQINPLDIHDQVEDSIKRLLPTQRCTLQLIATRLGIHERSLQRRLSEHGLVFENMIEQTRQALADLYLSEAHLPMAQIAAMLGYSEQSSFNRACRRWHGQTPRERRRWLRAAIS